MNHLSWNCRRLGNSRAVRVLSDLVKDRKPDFLYLSETFVLNNTIKELSLNLGFASYFAVDCIGRAGVWLLCGSQLCPAGWTTILRIT